ncbi:hypothetical protein ABBQ38_006480 [Trebouxia sp. C0009 RCD-2024]
MHEDCACIQSTFTGNLPEGDRRRLRRRISNRESAKRLRAGQQKSLNEVQVWVSFATKPVS